MLLFLHHPMKRAMRAAGIFGLYLAVIAVQQHGGGAVRGEYGGNPDEAGQFITGLMVRDYVAQGAPGSPMGFAQTYYAHYPKVALGHWPPLFFVVQAVWTLLLTPSRAALMLLTAVLGALTALAIYLGLRRDFGRSLSFAGGGLFLLIPVVQDLSMILMADMLTALLAFLAACWWGRFLDSERARDAAGFGFFAALAILTKGSGFALALLPPLAVLFSREFGLLKKPAFWVPPLLIVGVLCVPWYVLTYPLMVNGFEHPQGPRSSLAAFLYYPARFVKDFGIPLSGLAVVGLAARVFRKDEGLIQSQWIVRGALLFGFYLFHCIVTNAYDIRYLLPTFAAAVMLAVAGADELGRLLAVRFGRGREALGVAQAESGKRKAKRGREALGVALLGVALAGFALTTYQLPMKSSYGFAEAARLVLSRKAMGEQVCLVASDAEGEGMFIAQMAMREQRPGHVVLRSSKLMARSLWSGDGYKALFHSPEELLGYLESLPVHVLIHDTSLPEEKRKDHHRLLDDLLRTRGERLARLNTYPVTRRGVVHPAALSVYALSHARAGTNGTLNIDLPGLLNKGAGIR